MANGTGFLNEIAELISDRLKQMDQARSRLQQLETEVEALETAAQIYRQAHNITQPVDPNDLKGKTQIQALLTIARAANGQFKVNDAKRVMLQAGLIANPKNAASILYTLIKNYEHFFDKVEPGVYRLRETRPGNLKLALA